jgi:hypothetical protein
MKSQRFSGESSAGFAEDASQPAILGIDYSCSNETPPIKRARLRGIDY